ncbi:MAG: hypothetical protein AAB426_11100, partial [Myxococcota bacterium]
QRYLERARARGAGAAIWDIAKPAWRQAGELEKLGRWRLDVAKQAAPEEALWLRLVGYAELVESGDAEAAVQLEANLQSADLTRADVAWAVMAAAQTLQQAEWEHRAAVTLEKQLGPNDPRLPEVLQARIEQELRSGKPDGAVELARRLVLVGADGAERQLERTLEAAGRIDELMRLLTQRAQAGTADAPATWVRIARLHAERKALREAQKALGQVAPPQRTLAWGEVACRVGEDLSDSVLFADGAALRGSEESEPGARAMWLRRAAQTRWWTLDDAASAAALLHEAHEIEPVDLTATMTEVTKRAQTQDKTAARQLLEETLVVLPVERAGPCWLTLAELCAEDGAPKRVGEALVEAYRNLPEDARLWGRLGSLARHYDLASLAVEALAHAYGLSADWESVYVEVLEQAHEYGPACDVAVERAKTLDGSEAAVRWKRAASYALEHLSDRARALEYLGHAVEHQPTRENLGEAMLLAAELAQHEIVARLAPVYESKLAAKTPERLAAVRAHVDALEALGRNAETASMRRELWTEHVATAHDKAMLGRLVWEDEAATGATLLEEAAADEEIDDRAALLLDAAQGWLRAQRPQDARRALSAALTRGSDSIAAHTLAIELLEGEDRLKSVARLVELDGDAAWPAVRRLDLRCELAQRALQQGKAPRAHELLREGRSLGHSALWARVMERTLEALGDSNGLADLWLTEARGSDTPWRDQALVERVRRAATFWQQTGVVAREIEALDLLLERSPEPELLERAIEVAAELKDRERFGRYVEQQLAAAAAVDERSALALRHAPMFRARFDDQDTGARLLERTFATAPSMELAAALEQAMLEAGRAKDLVRTFLEHAARLSPEARIELLDRTGELAVGAADDAPAAFEAFREVALAQPTNERARQFCVEYAVAHDRVPEAVDILEHSAARLANASTSFALLIRATDLAEARLHDNARQRTLLRTAVEWQPNDGHTVGRLVHVLVVLDELDAAVEYLLDGLVDPTQEIALGIELADALVARGRTGDADQVRGWVASRHPESSAAGAIRLSQARQRGDARTVVQEIDAVLATGDPIEAVERLALVNEAAQACLALGDAAAALRRWMAALDLDGSQVEVLRRSYDLAGKLGATRERAALLQRAVDARVDIERRAAASQGEERLRWFFLLGQACACAADYDAAVLAYRAAMEATPQAVPPELYDTLVELHTGHGDWPRLVELYESRATGASPKENAELAYRAGLIWRDRLVDESKAARSFAQALEGDPGHQPALLAYGLLLHSQHQHEKAVGLLERCVSSQDLTADLDHLVALAESLRGAGVLARAQACAEAILAREPQHQDMAWMRAELLEQAGDDLVGEEAWVRAIALRGGAVDATELATIYVRLGKRALARPDSERAIEHLRRACELEPTQVAPRELIEQAYERAEQWHEAASVRAELVELCTDPAQKGKHRLAWAALLRDKLTDVPAALAVLEQASLDTPDDVQVTRALLDTVAALHDMARYLVVGERLLQQVGEAQLDAAFFAQLAQAYDEAAGDSEHAKYYYEKATERDPQALGPRAKLASLAKATGDFATYAAMQEAIAAQEQDPTTRVASYKELAEVYATRLGASARAVDMLLRARELDPHDRQLLRQLADAYVLDTSSHANAAVAYRDLLAEDPFDGEVLRILARLQGQQGDTEQAYLYYAALLTLSPRDDEARKFVEACRAAVPAGPQREISDADRAQGVV